MTTTILFLISGLALLLAGANFLVNASIAIAQRAKVSSFIIGIAVASIGTSLPELFISVPAAAQGLGDIAIGSVIGSNICNGFLILGLTAIIYPIAVTRQNMIRDIPFGIFVSVLLLLLCSDSLFPLITQNEVGRLDAIVFLIILMAYIAFVILQSRKDEQSRLENEENAVSRLAGCHALLLWLIATASLAALLFGGNLLLDSVVALARQLDITDKVVSLTIVSICTSLPELVVCIMAATRKSPQLALGNVLGSNIFNVLGTLGLSALIRPIVLVNINIIDLGMMVLATVPALLCAFTFKQRTIGRREGIIFVAIYIIYMAYTAILS